MIIKYSAYKYSPETARASVNGLKLDLHNTFIGTMIACNQNEKAIQALKKLYRKEIKKPTNYIYAFFVKDSNSFYYIKNLTFNNNADIKERLHCYTELKNYLQENTPTIKTESGKITPYGASKPETKTVTIEIDFTRCRKIKIV